VEASLKDAKPEQAYQFEREGYFCADNKLSSAGAPGVQPHRGPA
jgi:hypothetical protein